MEAKADKFAKEVREWASWYRDGDMMLTMGGDFHYSNAHINFANLDKLIAYFNKRTDKYRVSSAVCALLHRSCRDPMVDEPVLLHADGLLCEAVIRHSALRGENRRFLPVTRPRSCLSVGYGSDHVD